MKKDWIGRFTIGATEVILTGAVYPVCLISTAMEWDDIVLNESDKAG